MQKLQNKVAIVAGGAAGIGAVTARHLAREGAAVVIGDLDGERAQRLAASLREEGAQALGVHCDISDEGSVAALVAAAVEGFGGLDLMHVNAADMRSLLEDTNVLWRYSIAPWQSTCAATSSVPDTRCRRCWRGVAAPSFT